MKKFFSIMMIAAAAFGFAACQENTPGTPDDGGNDNQGGGTKQLEAPVLAISETTDYGFTVAWEAVENADSYTVNLKGKNFNTTETSYTFDNLNAGTYDVRVKAVGEGYKDSAFATISATVAGATTVDWFTQEVRLPEASPEDGIYPTNSIEFTWKGTGVKNIRYGLFYADNLAGIDQPTIIINMEDLGPETADIVAKVNSAEGFTAGFWGSLEGGTNWALCVEVENEAGLKFFTRSDIATEEAQASEEAKAWIGTWNATTTQIITIDGQGVGVLSDQVNNFTLSITASPSSPDQVVVDGLSVLGEGNPTVANVGMMEIDEEGTTANVLEVMTCVYSGYNADSQISYYWLPYLALDGELFGINMFENQVPSHYFMLNEDGTVTGVTGVFGVKTNDDVEHECEVISSEVYGIGDDGRMYFLISEFPAVYRAGAVQITKAAAAPAAKRFNVAERNYPMTLSSVVLR